MSARASSSEESLKEASSASRSDVSEGGKRSSFLSRRPSLGSLNSEFAQTKGGLGFLSAASAFKETSLGRVIRQSYAPHAFERTAAALSGDEMRRLDTSEATGEGVGAVAETGCWVGEFAPAISSARPRVSCQRQRH